MSFSNVNLGVSVITPRKVNKNARNSKDTYVGIVLEPMVKGGFLYGIFGGQKVCFSIDQSVAHLSGFSSPQYLTWNKLDEKAEKLVGTTFSGVIVSGVSFLGKKGDTQHGTVRKIKGVEKNALLKGKVMHEVLSLVPSQGGLYLGGVYRWTWNGQVKGASLNSISQVEVLRPMLAEIDEAVKVNSEWYKFHKNKQADEINTKRQLPQKGVYMRIRETVEDKSSIIWCFAPVHNVKDNLTQEIRPLTSEDVLLMVGNVIANLEPLQTVEVFLFDYYQGVMDETQPWLDENHALYIGQDRKTPLNVLALTETIAQPQKLTVQGILRGAKGVLSLSNDKLVETMNGAEVVHTNYVKGVSVEFTGQKRLDYFLRLNADDTFTVSDNLYTEEQLAKRNHSEGQIVTQNQKNEVYQKLANPLEEDKTNTEQNVTQAQPRAKTDEAPPSDYSHLSEPTAIGDDIPF